ncbi:MAG: ABC transporter permease [Acutalibacteraceae bacterium]
MCEVWKNAVRSIWRKRLRALLTIVGIVIGIALVTVVTLIGDAGKSTVNQELESMGLGGLSVTADKNAALTEQQLKALRSMSSVSSAVPLILSTSPITFLDGSEDSLMVCGIDSGETQVIGLTKRYGHLLSVQDVALHGRVCVVDTAVAERLYARQNIVGKQLTFSVGGVSETFTVVGVTEAGSTLLQNVAQWIPGMVYIPYTTMQELSGRDDFDQFAVRLMPDTSEDKAARDIEQTLSRIGKSGGYTAENLTAQRDKLSRLMDIVTLVLTAISAISLLVSGLSIMTIMMVSVNERTKEIGIKKALGASGARIRTEFLAESLLLSLCGGGAGVLLGGTVALGGLSFFGVTARLSLETVGWLVGFAAVIGVLFGVYPAAKAASLNPVDALRAE